VETKHTNRQGRATHEDAAQMVAPAGDCSASKASAGRVDRPCP
jgi:hypothetical protein